MADINPADPRYPGHGYDPLEPDNAHADEHAHAHGPGGVGKYVLVFIALLVLTGISFAVGNSATLRENAPGVMWAAMMAVSCAKAMLVILFFMHMLWEANWKYVLTIPASMMSIFLLLMLIPDIGRRTSRYADERWLYAAQPQSNSHAIAAKAAKTHAHTTAGHSDASGHSDAAGHSDTAGHSDKASREPAAGHK
jgi:cytochrome c oxidase subunit 4